MFKKTLYFILLAAVSAFALTVDQIMDKMEEQENPKTSRVEMTQTVYNTGGQENISKLISYSYGKGDKSLMEYLEPARIKGMKILTLNKGDDIWFYSPRTARVRKIAGHQKKQSVNNSDFSYEDLSTSDRREDYNCSLAGTEKFDGTDCYKLEMIPKDENSSYSKVIFWVDTITFVAKEGHYFNEDGELWKKLILRDVVKINGYLTPKEIEMKDLFKGSRTLMKMEKIEYDIDLDEKMFSERNLQR